MTRTKTFRLGALWAAAAAGVLTVGSATPAIGAHAAAAHPSVAAHAVSYRAVPTFSNPPHKGSIIEPESARPLDLQHGYVEREFFAAGRASAFKATSSPNDGKWSIARTTAARYRTRILVRRPPASRFNGTVIVEWMNVTEGESAPDWDFLNPMLMRAGYAYVAVSDQALGVNGGTSLFGQTSAGLVGSDKARYGSLHHPGDRYSLDIFAQIGTALHNSRTAAHLLGGLHPRRILATGESQSAYFLTTFADALQPRTHAYDGIFIHSRGGSAGGFNGTINTKPTGAVRIRTDLHIPVFMFETETDLIGLGYASAQQPNTPKIRTWEVAGTSHADSFVAGPYTSFLGCKTRVNSGPQHIVVQAAFASFAKWVTHKTAPPAPRPFTLSSTNPAVLALAADGNVRGGARTPAVNVPISTLSGAAPTGANETCSLFGSTKPFTKTALVKRYGTPAHYRSEYKVSLDTAISHGYILEADRATLIKKAATVSF